MLTCYRDLSGNDLKSRRFNPKLMDILLAVLRCIVLSWDVFFQTIQTIDTCNLIIMFDDSVIEHLLSMI